MAKLHESIGSIIMFHADGHEHCRACGRQHVERLQQRTRRDTAA